MRESRDEQSLVEMMLDGPRGRRLLLEYALASERLHDGESREESFSSGVVLASYHLDPGKRSSASSFGHGAKVAELTVVTPEETAGRLASVVLAEVTPELLLLCLSRSVDMARYWQDPDGEEVLAGTGPMREALRRVAEHLAASAETYWWRTPVEQQSQSAVQWDDAPPKVIATEPLAVVRVAREKDILDEQVAARERPADPAAPCSGYWWSRPALELLSSSRELFDGSPAGLWLVEDSLGWEGAESTRLGAAAGLRVFEIDTAEAWAELCARFPLEQTAQKRHDWYRTTGRVGRWVIPDWARVAEHYDAVHLHVAAYLAAAGTVIPVDAETATVIAGWNPDETYWFTPRIRYLDDPVAWVLEEHGTDYLWVRKDPSERKKP